MKNIEWIRQGLKEPGKSQKGLAEALHITQPQVSRLLTGHRRLKADEIDVIANYLGVKPPTAPPEKIVFPEDNYTAALLAVEYLRSRSGRELSPTEKVAIVGEFRDLIAKLRNG